jgi:hypothetical protein
MAVNPVAPQSARSPPSHDASAIPIASILDCFIAAIFAMTEGFTPHCHRGHDGLGRISPAQCKPKEVVGLPDRISKNARAGLWRLE